jgi:hypothetical protein
MTRDPRTNPQKGDVLRKGAVKRTVMEIEPAWSGRVRYMTNAGAGRRVPLASWQAWARDAEVVTGEG